MANSEDIERAKQGRDVWNAWADAEVRARRRPEVDFSNEQIDVADFSDFQFPGLVLFTSATLPLKADFSRAVFWGNVFFLDAQFLGEAEFFGATFQQEAFFDRAIFSGYATFSKSTFNASSSYVDVTFSSNSSFIQTKFGPGVGFQGVVFTGTVLFNNSTMGVGCTFYGARFLGSLSSFEFTRFENVPDFRSTTFVVPPSFHRTVIVDDWSKFPTIGKRQRPSRALSQDAAKYRRLQQLAAEAKDRELELSFFARELRAKRFWETKGFWPLALNYAFEGLSDYGSSIARPIAWLVASTLLAAGFIAITYAATARDAISKFAPALALAFTNATLLLGSDKWELRKEAFEALCGPCKAQFGLLGDLLAYAQSSFSVLLILLIGLALRNRFRVGSGD
jgi:hypothetical protein